MGAVAKNYVRNAGVASAKIFNKNLNRSFLQIINKHATQTVKIKFDADIVAADVSAQQIVTFSGVPSAGQFFLRWNGINSTAILFGDNAAAVQVALRTIAGLASVTVSGSFAAGFTVVMVSATPNVEADLPLLSVQSSTLDVTASVATTVTGKFADGFTIAAAGGTMLWPEQAPVSDIYALASGADTRVEIIEG